MIAPVLEGLERWCVTEGDAAAVLAGMPADSVDAIVTDPPAGIGFMGAEWDDYRRARNGADAGRDNVFGRTSRVGPEYGRARDGFVAAMVPVFTEMGCVLKPGGHGVVWALPRTSHWTATALEAAGLEVRDVIAHHFASGFPKSLDVGRELGPAWQGWGTALKPATEFWILVRRPLRARTIAGNVAELGTGALNIAGCRVPIADGDGYLENAVTQGLSAAPSYDPRRERRTFAPAADGRWPANLVLSHAGECEPDRCAEGCPVAELDRQSGQTSSAPFRSATSLGHRNVYGDGLGFGRGNDYTGSGYADAGGASRFFYVAKPDREERNRGLEAFAARRGGSEVFDPRTRDGTGDERQPITRNHHPTVKPVALMQQLVRLVTPPGGVVCDPFTGSGTTGMAALREGARFVGVERDPDFVAIARARIVGDAPLLNTPAAELGAHTSDRPIIDVDTQGRLL